MGAVRRDKAGDFRPPGASPGRNRAMSVLCLGEAIVDLICERPVESLEGADAFAPHFGGALANAAVAVSRSGQRACLGGGVGRDEWGRWLRRRLEQEGVDLRWFGSVDGLRSPLAFVTFDADGEPSFAVYGDGIEAGVLHLRGRLEEAVRSCSALAFGSNTLVGEAERELTLHARSLALEAGKPVCFDPNLRLHRWGDPEEAIALCRDACEGAFLVRANLAEATRLTGESDATAAAEAIAAAGATLAVVTRGPDGAVMRGAASGEHAGIEVRVASTLGAGDAFFGAMIAGLAAAGWDPAAATDALGAAVAASAEACTHLGAQP